MPIVPPGGFAGMAQQVPAVQHRVRKAVGGGGVGRRKRRKAAKSASAPRRRKRRASGKKGRLVKGSAAAKAYMAKIRRKRK